LSYYASPAYFQSFTIEVRFLVISCLVKDFPLRTQRSRGAGFKVFAQMNNNSSSGLDITPQTTIAIIAKLIKPYNICFPDCWAKSQECWEISDVVAFGCVTPSIYHRF